MKKCPNCDGCGIYEDHAPSWSHGEYGECLHCPEQFQCEVCNATGKVDYSYEEPKIIQSEVKEPLF